MRDAGEMDLLRDYHRNGSEEAFSELVRRHINLVHSVALRHVGIAAQAEEITQAVFIILARKAGSLRHDTILEGWLYETTRLTSLSFARGERRRQFREQEAYMRSTLHDSDDAFAWSQLSPLLDEAIAKLGKKDRDAVVLRFFKEKDLRTVAISLQVTEAAAQRRVHRAVEKLRKFFSKRGITVPAAVLTASICANSIQAAPAALAKSVTVAATAKSAAASSSLVKVTLKIMAWTKAKTVVVATVVALLATGTATVTVKVIEAKKDEALQIEVLRLVEGNSVGYQALASEYEKIQALGPKAFLVLSNLVEWRENLPDRQYEKMWPFLPAPLKKRFKDSSMRQLMRGRAVELVNAFGPVAVRPMTSSLCRILDDADSQATTYAIRALYWSIPESTNSINVVTNWLADPTHTHLFGDLACDELWPDLPGVVPSLTECLRNPYITLDAARALGIIGKNAQEAVPMLIQVCDRGVASPPLELKYTQQYQQPGEPELMNRQAAFDALGKIGDASPKVIATIERGLNDKNDLVRFAAMRCGAALHQPLMGHLPAKLKTFAARRSYNFKKIIDWTGMLGPDGREALPWLQQFTNLNEVEKLPEGENKLNGEFPIDSSYFRLSAIIAICKIEPKTTRQYLPDLIAQIGSRWEQVEVLTNSPALKPEIISILEPLLDDTNGLRSAIAAYLVLSIKPDDLRALYILRSYAVEGKMNDRIIASKWLWEASGETKDVLRTCREAFNSTDSNNAQLAANILGEMGKEARPDVPALKSALWHKDHFVREQAGKVLRKIAPEEMPPIH